MNTSLKSSSLSDEDRKTKAVVYKTRSKNIIEIGKVNVR